MTGSPCLSFPVASPYASCGDEVSVLAIVVAAQSIPRDSSALLANLEPRIARILDFIEVEPTPAFREEVRAQAQRQQSYTSCRQRSPERFGLDPEHIRHFRAVE